MPPPAEGFAARFVLGPALRTQPDRRLVSLVRDGYETAFEEIVRRYGKPLSRYAAAIVGARGEDVTQDAFSKALLALRRGGNEIELRPWLFRIVRNTALNDLRDNPPSPELLAEAIAGGSNPAEEMERREELADLMRRLQALPEPQRAAIVMREMEGLSHAEIAVALGVSGGAARQAIHRGRQALRNGAGMLVPLPLLQALLAGGTTGTAEVAAGAGGVAGAGVALKAAAATVLVAGAVGAGVAVHNGRQDDAHAQRPAASQGTSPTGTAAESAFTTPAPAGSDDRHEGDRGDDRGRGREPGDDRGGHRKGSGDDHGGRGSGSDDGRRGGRIEEAGDDHGGDSGSGESSDDHGGHDGSSGSGGGPGPSGSDSGSGGGHQGSPQGETSNHGGPGPSGGSSGDGSSDDLASSGESGAGTSESQQPPAVENSGGGGPGPSEGSGSSGGSGSGSEADDGSGGGGDDHSGG